ncbi:arabinosyltransferase [Rhodococcus kroppenstedtii]|uniref:arabinosyltransferase domain-containing protein n=1 Tax=Rhodococcoides kroppenstedtii TaxID=293050 RepID=UPI001C9A5D74|nr:arabinosyltransferase [Rhodococcus kroppenstedtii]
MPDAPSVPPAPTPDRESKAVVSGTDRRNDVRAQYRTTRLIAVVAGLLGTLFAVLTPFLPVTQDDASIGWPQNGTLDSVDAPLMSQVPQSMSVTVPCTAVAALPAGGGLLLSTAPARGEGAALNAMFVRVSDTSVDVLDRNVAIASAPRSQVESSACTAIRFDSDITATTAAFEGLTDDAGVPRVGRLDGDFRPQVVGIYSDLSGPASAFPGLSVDIAVDSRFSSSPTLLKLLVMVGAVGTTALALGALARLDGLDGRTHRRFFPAGWWKPSGIDGVVVGALVGWHFFGANTSDDGYLLTMARVSENAGYMANYFRWFGVPEAPFGWYYDVLAAFAKVSTASPWMRLPALIAGVLCWLVISREVVPRLGRAVRTNSVAVWTGGLVFLAFWLPYDNGLRPEPIVALGALLTWCSVERAIATGRLLPAAVAAIVGAFTLASAPTGLMCVAAILAGIRPLTRIVVKRHRAVGTLPLLAPILSAGLLVLIVVFADQTFAAVRESTRVRTLIGPNLPWYNDFLRYYYLFVQTVDGSLARRFAFLVMLLCLFTTLVVLLRRKRIPGVPSGPAWRLIAVVFGTIFFMMFNPTKWTHHFGVYAGIAGSLAALTAVAVSASALRSRRNRTVFVVGLVFVLALSFSGINGYWYVSSYGVPWFDKVVSVSGIQSNTVLLGLFFVAVALAGWHYLREGFAAPQPKPGTVRGRRIRKFAAAPLTVVAGLMVLFALASLLKGAVSQYPAYSLGRSNVQALAGNSCGLARDVLVESDPNQGILQPLPGPVDPELGPLGGEDPVGFSANGVPTDLSADAVEVKPGQGNTDSQSVGASFEEGQSSGTAGGVGAVGVNGSTAALPFGLNPASTPVLGSYQPGVQTPARAASSWYGLPAASDNAPLIVVSAAGRIWSEDPVAGTTTYGQSLRVEYGRTQPDGTVAVQGDYLPKDIGPAPSWRNLRIPRADLPADTDAVRIVANDPNLTGDQWLAFTPPRVPVVTTLQDEIGSEQPVLLDWAVGLQFPCQRPFDHRVGVAEVPGYRILPDRGLAVSSTDTWQAGENGGPLGFTEMLAAPVAIPTYLNHDWGRDWGSLERYDRFEPSATAADVEVTERTRSGLWSPGTLRVY